MKEGTLRMCINYKALDANTIIDAYTIPHINDILNHLGNSVIFSKIELAQGYYQVQKNKGHDHRIVF